MKKSILIFILWAVITVILTGVYLALTMFQTNARFEITGWIIYLCVAVLTLATMPIIRTQAKAEQVTWLAVVSKVLMIIYSVWGAVGLLLFVLSRIIL